MYFTRKCKCKTFLKSQGPCKHYNGLGVGIRVRVRSGVKINVGVKAGVRGIVRGWL